MKTAKIDVLLDMVRSLEGFPWLKVRDWMPLLMKHCCLQEKVKGNNPLYRKVHSFCQNAAGWKKVQKSVKRLQHK